MYRNVETPMQEQLAEPAAMAPVPDTVRRARAMAQAIGADGFVLFFDVAGIAGSRLQAALDTAFPDTSRASVEMASAAGEGFARAVLASCMPAAWGLPSNALDGGSACPRWLRLLDAPVSNAPVLAFPVSCRQGRAGIALFHGTAMQLDERMLADVHLWCHGLFAEISQRRPLVGEQLPAMSSRELECLRHTANGLTSEDIAKEIGLSAHTANQYLSTTAGKLNAVNRIHAVAKALRIGLID